MADTKNIEIINLVEKFILIFLLKLRIIRKIPEKIINNKALVSLELWALKGWGYSKPSKYPDILVKNFI